ncbi:hypothetical protein ACFL2V_17455 [Pseudomonadota bacterium]
MKVLRSVLRNTDENSIEVKLTWFNGERGFVIWDNEEAISAFNFTLEKGGISALYVHRNPEKLSFFN